MADIHECAGNIFGTDCEVITVTVNCEGVMGAGIALEARYRWPALNERYETLCREGALQPGRLLLWSDETSARRVLCFPTKDRWREPSRLAYVESGLQKLVASYKEKTIRSIALPHLGCNHGGLDWDAQVRPLIYEHLSSCEELRVELWDFDPVAHDPKFDELRAFVTNRSISDLAADLEVRVPAARALIAALAAPAVTGFSTLHEAPGIGEKTLEKVYALVFRSAPGARQQSLF